MGNVINLVERDVWVRIDISTDRPAYDVVAIRGSKKGQVLTKTDRIFLVDVSFRIEDGMPYVQGRFRGRVPHAHEDQGALVSYDSEKGLFARTDTGETIKKYGMATIFGNKIRVMP